MNEAEAWLRAITETTTDGIVIVDEQGTLQLFNRACERLFGYQAGEAVGRNIGVFIHAAGEPAHDFAGEGQLARLLGTDPSLEGRRADGSVFPIEISVAEIPRTGQSQSYVGIIRDRTQQQASEQVLLERAERLRSIIETGPDAVIVIDERGEIETFSPAAERLFGWTSDEVRGRNIKMLMPSPYHDQHDGYIERYRRTGERRIIGIGRVVVGQRRDGSTFPMELAVGEAKVPNGRLFTGFIRDLSERQDADRRLQEMQTELLHVARLSDMGQMAAALAHELNQPLTAVINWTQATRRTLQNAGIDLPPKAEGFMQNAIDQANRAGQIIRRLRSFIEKGESESEPEEINKVVEEATALALVGAKESGVRVTFAFIAELPLVLIDKVQVQQVVINLVRNAIEAMASVERRQLVVGTGLAEDGMVVVRVADTGPGLPAEVASQLFQPFVTTKQKGMGLGLSISRSIIDNHGGRLQADPNQGGGMIFSFTLPAADDEDEPIGSAHEP